MLSERSKPFSHFLYGISLPSSLPKIPLWERFTFLIVHGELQFPRFVRKRIGETSLPSYNMGIFDGTDSMPDSQSIQHHPSMERVPSSDGACSVVGCGVFHRRVRRITRPATRCSVGSSMPHRLYDPESHNRGGYSRRPGERRVATDRAKHGSQSGKERLTDRQSEKTCAANCELQINVVTLPSLGWRTSSTSEASKLESFHSA